MKINEVVKAMTECEQTRGQSVYQHGVDVFQTFDILLDSLWYDKLDCFRLTDFIKENRKELYGIHNMETCEQYLVFHDCGKPFCKTIDNDGKVHFPDHANISKKMYLEFSDYEDKETVANLIGWDMVLHIATSEEVQKYLENVWTRKDACTLALAAISEVHSNAKLFGGNDSVSFKSKIKKVLKRVNQIIRFYKEN